MKKYNIFVINPVSIVGDIIIRGIARGFESFGHNVLSMDVRELDEQRVKEFNPDFVLGLGYAHLYNKDAEQIVKNLNVPVAHYFIDDPNSHFAHSGDLSLYERFAQTDGIVFSWDREYLDSFKQKAYFLPVGIDTDLYKIKPQQEVERAKIVFTGRPLTDKREQVVAHIVKNFPGYLQIYSYQAHFEKSVLEMKEKGFLNDEQIESYKKCYKGFLASEEDLAAVYHNSDMILNITMDQGPSSMNYRVLEVMASGAFLLTDFVADTAEFFEEDKDFVFYRSFEELSERIEKYISNPDLRAQIAGNGQKKVEAQHTLIKRAEEILRVMEDYLP